MITYLWIALGSAIGGVARYACQGWAARVISDTFPWGTMIVNIVGCSFIGFFATFTSADGRFIVGTSSYPSGMLMFSEDAETWTKGAKIEEPGLTHFRHGAFGNGVFVLVGNGHGVAAGDVQRHAMLDALQLLQFARTLLRVRILDQHRGLQVGAVRNQRVVGVEFVLDAGRLEHAFDTQHFLDLVLDRQAILEHQRDVRSDRDAARTLVFEHARAERIALARIGFEGEQIAGCQFFHGLQESYWTRIYTD